MSQIVPEEMKSVRFFVPSMTWSEHGYVFLKACLVLGSWTCAYFGMKNIPITIYSPIRATQPIWTVLGALLLFSEVLPPLQVVGVTVTILSFYFFSLVGLKEGVSWKTNHWVWLVILSTLLGADSGLYDKHLMQSFDRVAVQVYSTIYQLFIIGILLLFIWFPRRRSFPFQWRWSILGISVFLMMADYVYYWSLSSDGALISVISTIRRSGAIVPFTFGALILKEKNLKVKSLLLCGILLGVTLLTLGALRG